MVWDSGTYEILEGKDPEAMIREGRIRFHLEGKRLKDGFTLIRTAYQGNENSWLLTKEKDSFAPKEGSLE